jgi:hypothetical protein
MHALLGITATGVRATESTPLLPGPRDVRPARNSGRMPDRGDGYLPISTGDA